MFTGRRKTSKKTKELKEEDIGPPEDNTPAFVYDLRSYTSKQDPLNKLRQDFALRDANASWVSCSSLYHFYFSDMWKCGYRNIQILSMAALSSNKTGLMSAMFCGTGFVPHVFSLQRWIERAWKLGYDAAGGEDFNGRLHGRRDWIGATEATALFRSFGVRTLLFDFRTSPETSQLDDFYQKGVVDFLFVYFQQGPVAALEFPNEYRPRSSKSGTKRSVSGEELEDSPGDLVLPVYMQYQGHSRTVVGVEETEDGERFIIYFDPIINTERFGYNNPVNRRNAKTLQHREYQLLFMYEEKGDSCLMGEKEREASKIIDKPTQTFII